jgi:hypothetical protein
LLLLCDVLFLEALHVSLELLFGQPVGLVDLLDLLLEARQELLQPWLVEIDLLAVTIRSLKNVNL